MDRVEEIETAITSLPPEDYRRLVDWFRTREQIRWDEQMDQDSVEGKLDFLFSEAESDWNSDFTAVGMDPTLMTSGLAAPFEN